MAYPLLGTKIVIDEEKFLREKKYNLSAMYEYLDELGKQCDLIRIDKNTFHAKGNENDLANLGIFIYDNAIEKEWLTKNVKEWIWISQKEGNKSIIGSKFGVWK